ncbi:MAG TPA: hypothetical protein DIC54_10505 [Pseudomonas sp.]|nr:hypothetical protein [Pseudomonas sp.]
MVDDAIVEVENIVRHLRMGKTPYQAAMEAADEIGLAVIATTFTLIAVFLPTAFMSGIAGRFFKQFGWTAALAVFASLVVARLLTPMMAAYIMKPMVDHEKEPRWLAAYMRASHWCLKHRVLTLLGALLFLMIGREGFTAFSEVMTKMEEISRSGQQIKPDDAAALVANLPAKRIALWMLLVFLSAVALSLAMFTQPALVVFDKQSGMHALRLSLQGCIENIGAMFVFAALGLIAAFCMYILFVIVIQIAMLIGGPLAAAFIAQLVLTTVLMPLYVGAVYAAWKQMFVHRGSRAAPPIPTTPTSSDVFHA